MPWSHALLCLNGNASVTVFHLESTSETPMLLGPFMTENVYWVLEFEVNPDRFEDLKILNAELVEATRKNEVGMLDNHWAISDDRRVCHIYERFQDSAAVMTHLQWFGANFAERFMELLKPTRVVVYGTPSVELKNAIAGLNPVYMAPLEGFRR